MLLGCIIERVGGSPLDQFVAERIAEPLRADPLRYLPLGKIASLQETIAPTEWDEWRNRLLCGEVHDQNAAAMGGVAGHAGLFGTAQSVLALTGAWLAAYHRRNSIFETNIVREITERQAHLGKASWALGWDTPSPPSSSGQYFSSKSFGHLGYTGTSMWIDPEQELEVVLLSNRVHPTSKNETIKSFRPAIHDLVYREFVKA
jgi:CubicO group peptidase (beta-lactamase class C family)